MKNRIAYEDFRAEAALIAQRTHEYPLFRERADATLGEPRMIFRRRRVSTRRCPAAVFFSFPLFLLAFLAANLPAAAVHAQAVTRYQNTVNTRFATVSGGPQSSVVIDVPSRATDTEERSLIRNAARAQWTADVSALRTQAGALRHAAGTRGIKAGVLPISTLIAVRKSGRLVLPPLSRTRAVGGGALTFTYTGFSDADRSYLQTLVSLMYPRIIEIYGAPSWTGNVEIVNTGPLDTSTIPQVQRAAFGGYDVSNSRILLPIFDNQDSFAHALLLNMVHAFHGPAVFQYDAWEQGFARAASAAIICRFNANFGFEDATANYYYTLLPFYDLLNQPALGNSTFFPPSQANLVLQGQATIGKMLLPRLGMSGAAWLKVYIENPNFFKQFNAAYYAQFDPNATPSLAGNVPALRDLAAPILPSGVEGTPWSAWYEQQYILDTSVSVGPKLYAFVLPGIYDQDAGQSATITLVYVRGKANGDEDLINGTAYATYFDATNARIPSLGPASEQATIGANGSDGEGFLTTLAFPTQGFDAGRITMDFHVANSNVTARAYLPSGFTGDFQAVLLGPNVAGDMTVNQTTVVGSTQTRTKTQALSNAAYGVGLGTGYFDLTKNIITVSNNGTTETYQTNSGFGQHYFVGRRGQTGGSVVTLNKAFPVSTVPRLVMFPVRPLQASVADALALAPSTFLLSYWDATRSAYETVGSAATSVSPIEVGRGYWLKFSPLAPTVQIALSVTGIAPASDTDFTLSCPYGWNLIGSPFSQPIDKDKILVQYLQNDAISWSDAVSRSLVADKPFAFDPDTGNYVETTSLDGASWTGYWLRVLVPGGVNLLLPGPDSQTSRAQSPFRYVGRATTTTAAVAPRPDWTVHLRAQTEPGINGSRVGTTAFAAFGAASAAQKGFDNRYDSEAPPAIVAGVAVHFPHNDWGRSAGGRYVADFRALGSGGTGRASWDVSVDPPASGSGLVTLSWDNVGTVPRSTNLTLIDKETGTRTSLRGRSAYTFQAAGGKTRAFQMVAEPARSQPLMVHSIVASTTRAQGISNLSVSYVVTDPEANVTVEMATLGGRVIRHIVDGAGSGRAEVGGRRSVRWDGRSQEGAAVAPGVYLLNITARSTDGTVVRASRPVTLLQ